MRSELQALGEIVKGWGGSLHIVDHLPPRSPTFSEAPFAWGRLGVDFYKKTVYASGDFPIGGLIHEAGHVFASHKSPDYGGCESRFMGWEFLLARKVGLLDEWLESMVGYTIHTHDFGFMTEDEQSDIIEQYIEIARGHGLVIGEEPVSIRT